MEKWNSCQYLILLFYNWKAALITLMSRLSPLCFGTLGWICNQVCKPKVQDWQGQWQSNTPTVLGYKHLAQLFPLSNPWMYSLSNCKCCFSSAITCNQKKSYFSTPHISITLQLVGVFFLEKSKSQETTFFRTPNFFSYYLLKALSFLATILNILSSSITPKKSRHLDCRTLHFFNSSQYLWEKISPWHIDQYIYQKMVSWHHLSLY